MGFNGFDVGIQDLGAAANVLQQENEKVMADVKQTVAIAEEMAATWLGDAAGAFQQAKQHWDQGIAKMAQGMDSAVNVLRSNAQSYVSTDEANAAAFGGR